MTVADLIRELQQMPQQVRVHVLMGPHEMRVEHASGQQVSGLSWPQTEDAREADDVRHMGAFVLIRSR